jgi:hypothetical protein
MAIVIVIGLGVLLAGCGQSDEQVAGTEERSEEGCSASCAHKGDDMECAVTCSGAEGKEMTCTATCEHAEDGTCTITCGGETVTCQRSEDGTCTVECGGCTITCEKNEDGTCTVTCDGKTVECPHADGEKCGCGHAAASGCPGMARSGKSGGCPGSGATKVTEEEAS